MKEVEIVKILPTKIWAEKNIMGTIAIKIQHEGMPEFIFVQIHYDYAYTSNAHQWDFVKKIGKHLGVEDIEIKSVAL